MEIDDILEDGKSRKEGLEERKACGNRRFFELREDLRNADDHINRLVQGLNQKSKGENQQMR